MLASTPRSRGGANLSAYLRRCAVCLILFLCVSQVIFFIPDGAPANSTEQMRSEYLSYLYNLGVTTVKDSWASRSIRHNLGMLLERKDPTLPPVVYIVLPKAGSRTFEAALGSDPLRKSFYRKVFLHELENHASTSDREQPPVIFSVIRHPEDRIASAYSTAVVSRFDNFGLIAQGQLFNLPKPSTNDTELWIDHFRYTIHLWMDTVNRHGWNHSQVWWNEHIIPQHEFLRGYNISFIGCLDSVDDTFQTLNISGYPNSANVYEAAGAMPKEKFASFDLLDSSTKELVKEALLD